MARRSTTFDGDRHDSPLGAPELAHALSNAAAGRGHRRQYGLAMFAERERAHAPVGGLCPRPREFFKLFLGLYSFSEKKKMNGDHLRTVLAPDRTITGSV